MSKGKWKRILSAMLAVIMILCLAACGEEASNSEGESKDSGKKDQYTNSSLAKENVFAYENLDLSQHGDDVSIRTVSYNGKRVYMLLDIYVQNTGTEVTPRTAEAGVEVALAAASSAAAVDPGFGVMPEVPGDGTYVEPTHIVRVLSFLPDGSDMQYYDLNMEADGEEGQNRYINQVAFGSERVYAVYYSSIWDDKDPEKPIYKEIFELVCWDNSGTFLWKKELNECYEEIEYLYVSNLFADQNDTAYAVVQNEGLQIACIDKDGNTQEVKQIESPKSHYVYNVFMDAEGKLKVVDVNDSWTTFTATTYDLATGVAENSVELLSSLMQYNFNQGTTTDLVMTSSTGLYTYNFGDSEIKKVMDFINSDLESNSLYNIVMIDDTRFVATYYDIIDNTQKLGIFTKVDPQDIPDKTVLVLGTNYFDYNIRKQVIKFNKTNSKYRITVKEYYTYATAEDYYASYTQLNNDIIAGNMPDILVVDSNIPVDNYIAKGYIADVGKMLKNDEELAQIEFMENVFEAYSTDGKLYYVIPEFNVQTLIGKKSVLGDRNGWNMEEFIQFANQQPEDVSMFSGMTQQAFMYQILQYCGNDFIDPATGSCKFNTQEFMNLLEYVKTLPEEIKYDENYDWTKYESQYRENRTMLMTLYINNLSDLNYSIQGQFGEEVNFVGFPNENKNGSVVNASTSFVLSAKSKALEGAWEFVRYYLTDEYQDTIEYGLPVNKEKFLKVAQKATQKPYYTDENGNKMEYDMTYWINGEEIIIPPMTQAEVDEIVAFIETVNKRVFYNTDISNIIQEEAAYFLSGQKSAKEVTDIIQNRVNLYVMENR